MIIGIYLAPKLYRLLRLSKTKNFVCEVAKVTLNALCRSQIIKTSRGDIELKVKEVQKGKISCYITGGTEKESLIFADSLEEVFEKTENQRYIIAKLNDKLEEVNLYYNVPNILATNKDFAVIFSQYWNVRIGKYELIYTRTAKGRKMLLKARMKNMTLKDKVQKKQVYSAFK